jgi:hypothetical protein
VNTLFSDGGSERPFAYIAAQDNRFARWMVHPQPACYKTLSDAKRRYLVNFCQTHARRIDRGIGRLHGQDASRIMPLSVRSSARPDNQ